MEEKNKELVKLSEDYFGFMARAYPVMCSSDEFYFFPRAKKAVKYLDCLDSLEKQKIKQDISYVKVLKQRLERLNAKETDLETQIDQELLSQSMSGFIREFEQLKIWQSDPNLYLKIIILGIDQIVNKLSSVQDDIREELSSRIRQIPRLLNEARANLRGISFGHLETADRLVKAGTKYLKSDFPLFLRKSGVKTKDLEALTRNAIRSLVDFKKHLKKKNGSKEFLRDRETFEDLLASSFSYKKSLEEIFEIASEEYQKIRLQLNWAANHIQPSKSWQGILSEYKLKLKNKKELLNLYSAQILSLKDFLIKSGIISIPGAQNIQVKQTPVYLEPIRALASYSCPLTSNKREAAFFYVSIGGLQENIHQEYIFVSTHETYPGHHLLDSIRRGIKNPIRQQIESPLFYEGWASYVEGLVDEFRYSNDPRQKLVYLRRQAWRAIRAKLDVGIKINKIKISDAQRQLRWLGYSPSRVKAMLEHYLLTYGYQLCYTIGKFEIESLRKKFASKFGLKNFHNYLLTAGQLPFDLAQKKMEKICQGSS